MSKENISFYTVGKKLIENAERQFRPVLDVNVMTDQAVTLTNYDHLSREELEWRLARAELSIALYNRGYRSVIRGYGYFVNKNNIRRKAYADNLISNAKATAERRQEVYEELIRNVAEQFPDDGQYEMEMDGEDISIREGYTRDKILEMLEEDASSVNG